MFAFCPMVLIKNCLLIFVFKHSVQKKFFTFCIQELCPKTIFWFLCASALYKKCILFFVFERCVQKTNFAFCVQALCTKNVFCFLCPETLTENKVFSVFQNNVYIFSVGKNVCADFVQFLCFVFLVQTSCPKNKSSLDSFLLCTI